MGISQSEMKKSIPDIKENYYGGKLTTDPNTMVSYQ